MYFQIRELILWPKLENKEIRRLHFSVGELNVISGESKTGKSAIIPIIDYCLGSSQCRIPVGIIRNACGWYGVLIQLEENQVLFARQGPSKDAVSNDMYILQGMNVTVPSIIKERNSNVPNAKILLNEFAGIPPIRVGDYGGTSGFMNPPSFRDLVALIFQPQNIIANPNVLFYKSDSYEHREKLRNIFPYVLGAVTPQILASQQQIANTQKVLDDKERTLKGIQQSINKWSDDLNSQIAIARELGLLDEDVQISDDPHETLDVLKEIIVRGEIEPNITEEGVSSALQKLQDLRLRENSVSMDLVGLRRRYDEMIKLKSTVLEYNDVHKLRRERLEIADWIHEEHSDSDACLFCGSMAENAREDMDALVKALRKFEEDAAIGLNMPAAFDREHGRVQSEIREKSDELNAISRNLRILEVSSVEQKERYYKYNNILRFVGKLEQSIEIVETISGDEGLADEIGAIKRDIDNMKSQFSVAEINRKLDNALDAISRGMSEVLPSLDVEDIYKKSNCRLNIKDLLLRIVTEQGDEHYLWEIGSGANWLSFHLAFNIALQNYINRQNNCPVPGFLVIDQPSQVYFPKKLAGYIANSVTDEQLKDEDVVAVKRIFSTLAAKVQEQKGGWQAIVLDHASDTVWGGIENINFVEEWRNGKKLIPEDWIIS